MSNRTAVWLNQALRLAAKTNGQEETDRELLGRFAAHGDQAAFAALVDRHTGMVLGVCRRALPTVQDAEDATQATFLVLAKKAKTGRWQPSLANWLYGTARRVARNARVAADRRARREAEAAVPRAVQPVDQMTGRELLTALDEELDRLAPLYREPLVLCYLEGLTRDDAAHRLGIPAGTLKIRLERGRKKLGGALLGRGCALGIGLLALAATSPAAAAPPRLLQTILTAASGSPPAAVAALAKEIAVNGIINKSVVIVAALVGAMVLGIGLGAGRQTAAGQSPDKVMSAKPVADEKTKKDSAPSANAGNEISLSGSVHDPDGKLLAGVKLALVGKGERAIDLGASGTDGRFTIRVPSERKWLYLVARAEGFGVDFVDLGSINPAVQLELRAVKDRPIRGRVVDTQGKPVARATVSVVSVGVFANNSLDSLLREWKTRHFMSGLPYGVKSIWPEKGTFPEVTADADGRFAVPGLGAERFVGLRVRGAGIAEAELYVANRDGFDPKPYNQATADNIPSGMEGFVPRWTLYGPNPTVIAEAEKPIRGVVSDLDSGKPRAGVRVSLTRNGSELLAIAPSTTTDAEGRYEIHGARKAKDYMVEVPSDATAGYLPCQVHAADTPGYGPVTADVGVKKGQVITGRVLDGSSRKPLPGFAMVGVLSDNPFLKDFPTFDSSASFRMAETGKDGVFRIVTIPGPVLLMGGPDARKLPGGEVARLRYKPVVPDPKYPQYFDDGPGLTAYHCPGNAFSPLQGNFCKVLEIKPGTEVVSQDIVVEPASALPVKMEDADGMRLTNVWVAGMSSEDWHGPIRVDTCEVYNLQPGKARFVVFYEPMKKLVGSLSLKGDEKDPAIVKLGPAGVVTGRVAGEDGKPLAGVAVSLYHRERTATEIHNQVHRAKGVETDADGKFQIDEVIPGARFALSFGQGKGVYDAVTKPGDRVVKPGEAIDAGEIILKPKSQAGGE